jgi:hypothetical protein
MQTKQLTLFGDEDVVGTGRPYPWPAVQPEVEPETPTEPNPDQLAFEDDTVGEAA